MRSLYLLLFHCAICITTSALDTTDFLLTDESLERLRYSRYCPAEIFTGPQNSIHCRQPPITNYDTDDDEIGDDGTASWVSNEELGILNETRISDDENDRSLLRCKYDMERMIISIDESWAQQMLDSMGKPSSGITLGNLVWPGDYHQCLSTEAPAIGNGTSFVGQYCVLNQNLGPVNSSLIVTLGICVPDTCNDDTLANLTHITRRLLKSPLGAKMLGITCRPKSIPWDAPAIVMLTLISIFVCLALSGTALTLYEHYFPVRTLDLKEFEPELNVNDQNNLHDVDLTTNDATVLYIGKKDDKGNGQEKLKQFLKCFCVLTNGAKILDTSNKGDFRCVHGVRFLSMSWVILGHTYAFLQNGTISVGIIEALHRSDTIAFEGVTHGVFAVDSFFLLSGFLLTYLFLREADKKNGKISWGLYYFHRYWRLTPVYALVLGFDYALTRYVHDAPLWPQTGNEVTCKESWWYNLLYINNFLSSSMCMGWSWFLANDMQFYVISPIFLVTLWRWPKIGLALVGTFLLGSWICAGVISWSYGFFAGLSSISTANDIAAFAASMKDYFSKFYIRPYTRIGPYLVGVFLGYILYKEKDKKTQLSARSEALGWFLAIVLSLLTVYGLFRAEVSVGVAALYNALGSSIFTATLAWVIFCCITERGGVVDKILSYKLLIPLSRLTYCAYLVHPIIIYGYYQSLETSIQFTSSMAATLFLGFLVMSYMAAFATSLLFEAPFMAIEKMFIKRT